MINEDFESLKTFVMTKEEILACTEEVGTPWNKGQKMSEEFCVNRSKLMKGNKCAKGNIGKPKSEEHKQNISKALSGRPVSEERKLKQSLKMKNRSKTPEHKEKIRLAALGKKRGPYKKR